MKNLICDVCKKVVENPISNLSYFHIADIDICEPCKDDLDRVLKYTLRKKAPFDYSWYDEITIRILSEGMKKNRIDTKAAVN